MIDTLGFKNTVHRGNGNRTIPYLEYCLGCIYGGCVMWGRGGRSDREQPYIVPLNGGNIFSHCPKEAAISEVQA